MGFALISYSAVNQRIADSFSEIMSKNGIESRMEPGDIPASTAYFKEITGALDQCSCLVVLLSETVMTAPWTVMSIKKAISVNKPIIPVLVKDMQLNAEFKELLNGCKIYSLKKSDGEEFIAKIKKSIAIVEEKKDGKEGIDLIRYEISDGKAVIIGRDGKNAGEIKIPEKVDGYPVTAIGSYAFYKCEELTAVIIPSGVKILCRCAFRFCSSLTTVTIPEGVTGIGELAFDGCKKLKVIYIPKSVTEIENQAFEKGIVPVVEKGSYAETWAKRNNMNFRYSTVSAKQPAPNTATKDKNGTEKTDLVYSIVNGKVIISGYPREKTGAVKIPSTLEGCPVTSIGEDAFRNCKITEVICPEGLTSIGKNSFRDCRNLASVKIAKGVTVIGANAFHGCESLAFLEIPAGVRNIEQWAFCKCTGLISVKLPEGIKNVSQFAFCNCTNLTSVTFPNGVTTIGDGVFLDCINLTSVNLPNSLTNLGGSAFYGCGNLQSIVIPSGVQVVEKYTFRECKKLAFLSLPDGIKTICYGAFFGCESLTEIKIPDSVTAIGQYAFGNCKNIRNVKFPRNVKTVESSTFIGCEKMTSIALPDGVKAIASSAFQYCKGIKYFYIPPTVEGIGKNAFDHNTVLIVQPGSYASNWAIRNRYKYKPTK